MSRMWGLVLALLASAHAAEYGQPCANAIDCTDPWAPYCHIFFKDASYSFNDM